MLTELHIENLGVIERLDLVLGPGLTAVTGETGAGKTMLVEALELLVGARADATVVRLGAADTRVDGRFVVGDDEVVLSRVVPTDGRSRAYVDGRPSTVGGLGELAAGIVDLHGQHAHQSLLSPGTQRDALDRYGSIDLAPLREARARLTELDAELAALGGDARARAREIDLLSFQAQELLDAAVDDPDEDRSLELVEDELADAQGHREAGARAHAALADDGQGRDMLVTALNALGSRAPYTEVASRTAALLAELDDVVAELRGVADGIEEDPERLAHVRARRQLLRDLCRKYGDDLAAVGRYRDEATRRLRELERFDQRAGELDGERAAAAAAERSAAAAVGRARRAIAPRLARAVTERLQELAMPHAEVAITVGAHEEDQPGDQVHFLLSANPGAPLLPLTKVASGGELARTMLALRLVLTDLDGDAARTLVFDEVDAGIGGLAAGAVGQALATVAKTHQVLVVTHLAQVAAQASTQVVVTKHVAGERATATVEVVHGPRRVEEVARMLSGAKGGEAARRHAVELLGQR